VENQLD